MELDCKGCVYGRRPNAGRSENGASRQLDGLPDIIALFDAPGRRVSVPIQSNCSLPARQPRTKARSCVWLARRNIALPSDISIHAEADLNFGVDGYFPRHSAQHYTTRCRTRHRKSTPSISASRWALFPDPANGIARASGSPPSSTARSSVWAARCSVPSSSASVLGHRRQCSGHQGSAGGRGDGRYPGQADAGRRQGVSRRASCPITARRAAATPDPQTQKLHVLQVRGRTATASIAEAAPSWRKARATSRATRATADRGPAREQGLVTVTCSPALRSKAPLADQVRTPRAASA